jgi:hypothetical protein
MNCSFLNSFSICLGSLSEINSFLWGLCETHLIWWSVTNVMKKKIKYSRIDRNLNDFIQLIIECNFKCQFWIEISIFSSFTVCSSTQTETVTVYTVHLGADLNNIVFIWFIQTSKRTTLYELAIITQSIGQRRIYFYTNCLN